MDRDTTIRTTVALLLLGLTIGLYAGRKADTSAGSRCPTIKIVAERLPDMHTARASHCTFMLNGELTVVGGHTEGFVPTPTAEYLNGGRWHTVNMVYTHDNGFSAICKSGMVLVAGGHDQPLGIDKRQPLQQRRDRDIRRKEVFCFPEERFAIAMLPLHLPHSSRQCHDNSLQQRPLRALRHHHR